MKFEYRNNIFDILIDHCFEPNLTTKIFADAVIKKLQDDSQSINILELGCGSGILTIILSHFFRRNYHLSDIDFRAISTAAINLRKYSISANLIQSNGIDKWGSNKFDIIINDISGISEDIAKVSTWFKDAPSNTGRSGVELTKKILLDAKKNLRHKNSEIFFPAISLSNTESLLSYARSHYRFVEKRAAQSWPLPKDLEIHKNLLESLKETEDVNFEEKFGMIICNTAVYSAREAIYE